MPGHTESKKHQHNMLLCGNGIRKNARRVANKEHEEPEGNSEEESPDSDWVLPSSESEKEGTSDRDDAPAKKRRRRDPEEVKNNMKLLVGWWPQDDVIRNIGRREFFKALLQRKFKVREDEDGDYLYMLNTPA